MSEHITSTSKWSLAVHRVTETSVEVWVGTIFPTLKMPERAQVRLLNADETPVETRNIVKADWRRPFSKMNQRFFQVVRFTGLTPDTRYRLGFYRRIEAEPGVIDQSWQHLSSGKFDTLPRRIPRKGQPPFTIGLGSCFYDHRDGGQAAAAYRTLYERGPEGVRPALTFLVGDQVYLDIGFDSLSWVAAEIRQRIADDYARHWQELGSILNRGGTWMIPDDHEYWNDYPFHDSLVPTLLALKIRRVRNAWNTASRDAVVNIQRSPVVESFSIGNDLSICLADLRSFRSKRKIMADAEFDRLLSWARTLETPGVFVTPQPLIVEENEQERNLLSFKEQYEALVEALGQTGHDVVVLTGDVHFGRVANCKLGNAGGRLIEIIASPLSNLTYLNGVATSAPKHTPPLFPDPRMARIEGWDPVTVNYPPAYEVDTTRGFLGSAYPRERTREHFMTVSFSRVDRGVELSAQAWHVRRRGRGNLPMKDFDRPYRTTLR